VIILGRRRIATRSSDDHDRRGGQVGRFDQFSLLHRPAATVGTYDEDLAFAQLKHLISDQELSL
jgi:hypothetical protein